ncbi:hypothetical protein HOY80DRAFT_499465 [Tuber brumale]|nr:hypothetical protein HOY80DRAFT_499465 [Tuber brumale]
MYRTCQTCSEHARSTHTGSRTLFPYPLLYLPFAVDRSPLIVHRSLFAHLLARSYTLCRSPVYDISFDRSLLPSATRKNRHATYHLSPHPLYDRLPFTFRRIHFIARFVCSWFVRSGSRSFVLERRTTAEAEVGAVGNRNGMKAAWQRESLRDLYFFC